MPKINAEGVVTDATLSETPEPIEPDDLTPKPETEKPKADPPLTPDEDSPDPPVPAKSTSTRARPAKRTGGKP